MKAQKNLVTAVIRLASILSLTLALPRLGRSFSSIHSLGDTSFYSSLAMQCAFIIIPIVIIWLLAPIFAGLIVGSTDKVSEVVVDVESILIGLIIFLGLNYGLDAFRSIVVYIGAWILYDQNIDSIPKDIILNLSLLIVFISVALKARLIARYFLNKQK